MDVEQIVREYVNKTIHMSLATVMNNKPWVCEVHFAYDDELNLYFRSLQSRRHSQEIAANPNVAGNIVRQHAIDEYPHAIYFEGMAELVSDETKYEELCAYFMKRLNVNESIIEDAKKPDGHKFYKITVSDWHAFGKFDGDKGKKYSMGWNEKT